MMQVQLPLPFDDPTGNSSAPTMKVQADNLAEVALAVKVNLDGRRQAEVLSGLNTIARALETSLANLPSDPALLRTLLERCDPLVKGIGHGRWTKLRQHLGTALRTCGVEVFQARERTPISASWNRLLSTAGLKRPYGLQRMLKYFTLRGIEPGDLQLAHLEEFRSALVRTSLMPWPERAWKDATTLWNQAAVNSPRWPKVKVIVESRRRVLSVPWETFPTTFRADVEAFLGASNPDPEEVAFSEAPRAITAATADGRRKHLRLIASAYHHATNRGDELVDLAALTEADRVRAALTKLKEMQGGVRPTSIAGAEVLLVVARHWVRAGDDRADKIAIVIRNWRKALNQKEPTKGMRPKNRQRLRQFDDPEKLAALLTLPEKVRRVVCAKTQPTQTDARRLMLAVAVEILLVAPLRLSNLVSLQIGRHLQWSGRHREICRLLVPSEELKWRGEPIDACLNRETSALIRQYFDRYRALITAQSTAYLFPNAAGDCRHADGFSAALKEFVSQEIGARVHVHLFRGIALKVHFAARPGAVDDARRLLGHRHFSTTEKHYVQFENERAIAAHADIVQSIRSGARSMGANR